MTLMALDDAGDGARPRRDTRPADVVVAGLSGPLMRWTIDVLAAAMARHDARVARVSTSEGRWTPPDQDAPARLFVGDVVNVDWIADLGRGVVPCVVVIDDLAAACHEMGQAGHDTGIIVRHLVSVATALGDLAGQRTVQIVRHDDFGDPATVAARIVAHVGLPPESFDRGVIHGEADLLASGMPVPDSLSRFVESVLIPAIRYARTGIRGPGTWPRDCLFRGDQPGTPLPRVLDMTGPARVLAYGPYYALPAGRWTIRATLAFSPESRGMLFALELHGAARYSRFAFLVDGPGLFAASFSAVVPSSLENLEIRLLMERGAIEGTLGIDRIDLIPDQSVA